MDRWGTRAGRRGRSLVGRMYAPRIFGLALGFVCVAAVFRTVGVPWWLWAGLALHVFIWPHLAQWHGMRTQYPYAAARNQLLVDSALVGIWAAGMQFNALSSAAVVTLTGMANVAVGGPVRLAAGLIAAALTALATNAILRQPVRLESTPFEIYTALPLLIGFPLLVAHVCWRLNMQLAWSKRELTEQGARDGLTGLYNRAYWERRLREAFVPLRDSGEPAVLVLMDLDRFKEINDNDGHVAGDAALRQVATCLAASVRPGDLCARYGGDEFVVLVAGGEPAARALYERLRARLGAGASAPIWLSYPLSISAGACCCHPGLVDSEAWLREADAALYEAKRAGRGVLVCREPPEGAKVPVHTGRRWAAL